MPGDLWCSQEGGCFQKPSDVGLAERELELGELVDAQHFIRRVRDVELFNSPAQRDIVILLPNNQRQHRTLHIQKDGLPYALF